MVAFLQAADKLWISSANQKKDKKNKKVNPD